MRKYRTNVEKIRERDGHQIRMDSSIDLCM